MTVKPNPGCSGFLLLGLDYCFKDSWLWKSSDWCCMSEEHLGSVCLQGLFPSSVAEGWGCKYLHWGVPVSSVSGRGVVRAIPGFHPFLAAVAQPSPFLKWGFSRDVLPWMKWWELRTETLSSGCSAELCPAGQLGVWMLLHLSQAVWRLLWAQQCSLPRCRWRTGKQAGKYVPLM